ncbi:glucose/quinate/shikimate family membrane-bound PQQ-dependent dehydrogenase [Rhodopila globiformis]
MPTAKRPSLVVLMTAIVVVLIGLCLAAGGGWLIALGGSPYYICTGIALILTGILLFRARAAALWVYTVILLGTLLWAIWEAGVDFWPLVPRGDVLVLIGIWLLTPWVSRRLYGGSLAPRMALLGTLILSFAVLGASLARSPHDKDGTLAMTNAPAGGTEPLASQPKGDWQAYGGSGFGDRYAPLDQITPANVGRLKVAWTFRTGDMRGPNDPVETTMEVTPIKANHMVYLCSPHQIVFALDAGTGTLKWKFDPHVQDSPAFQHLTCRGVSYHETKPGAVTASGQPAPQDCPRRIFLGTNTGGLYALNADTGAPCESFGTHGRVDLNVNMPYAEPGFYEVTSPPVAAEKILIVGGSVIDNWSTKEPSGVIRGYDVYTGALVWAWDAGNPNHNEIPKEGQTYTPASPNSWSVSSADEKLGLVYVPLGEPDPDEWGGDRSAQQEQFDSSLVALEIATGKLRWMFQNVHHDLWDMDFPSQPSLVDVNTAQGMVPAVYIPAKTGNIFVLDRRDGKLIVPAPEKPVPQGAAPGDHLSPTQPFSELSFRPRAPLDGAMMWGTTPFDQLACRIEFHRLRYQGPFTPPSTQGTLVYPGNLGMFEWGGVAVDPVRQIIVANPMSVPFVSTLIPRGRKNPSIPPASMKPGQEEGTQPMFGTPFGVTLNAFMSPIGVPCMQPPWGFIAGLDLKTNKIVWQHPVGTTRDSSPLPVAMRIGMPMLGGPMVTAGGVAFLTSTADYFIRAFDVGSGRQLWEDRLPAGGQSTPMTYSEGGRQFVVTADGGHGSFGTKLGDYIIAYALPQGK